jgi:hypothetical protein
MRKAPVDPHVSFMAQDISGTPIPIFRRMCSSFEVLMGKMADANKLTERRHNPGESAPEMMYRFRSIMCNPFKKCAIVLQ